MKLGIILQSNKQEHLWNAFRLANVALQAGHTVQIVLMSEGVEAEDIPDTEQFDLSKKIEEFKRLKGSLLACGTCLVIRSKQKSTICPMTNMQELLKMVEDSDKVLVFG
ncbi:hypothetical protein A2239_01385 [Candidatus Uhrbacteria bacterium RIFOXYA2_FULL_40_9]|nr:MAG: hypothetical protein A2239_01385 [Candidatus Uhrbacteria bacterium RIFOXYA2_FULL_40_9]OGL98305.1 MAG: hypothetical protein A2332_03695 [Candidatus Uhrbacteria bacterium RIFOXYB2_FULL_41_18]HBK34981.1 hypothetical protein [Candidatus Uhrbacteria bacterium]HCB56023.1 hypothetical protein [Candidatus Uhrbacteria bacterium]